MKLPPKKHSNASSDEYWAELYPDALSLWVFLGMSAVSLSIGNILLAAADISWQLSSVLAFVWTMAVSARAWTTLVTRAQIRGLRLFPDGRIRLMLERGDMLEARLASGSIVLQQIAWLRIMSADQHPLDLLLVAERQDGANWRRFQVISRHIGPGS